MIISGIKPDNMHIILQKCTEMGVSAFYFIATNFCNLREISISKMAKFKAIVTEAAEQSERISVPKLIFMENNNKLLDLNAIFKILFEQNHEKFFNNAKISENNWRESAGGYIKNIKSDEILNLFCHPYCGDDLNPELSKDNFSAATCTLKGSLFNKNHDFMKNIDNLRKLCEKKEFDAINIFIGPEGGFSPQENESFRNYYQNESNAARFYYEISQKDIKIAQDYKKKLQNHEQKLQNHEHRRQDHEVKQGKYFLMPLLLSGEGLILRAETAAIVALNTVQLMLTLSGAPRVFE